MALSGLRPIAKRDRPVHPFDNAAWDKLSPDDFDLLLKYKRIDEIPFDSKHRRNLVLVKNGFEKNEHEFVLIVNGDYEEVAARSKLSQAEKDNLREWINQKAKIGCRVIAIAKKDMSSIGLEGKNISDYENNMDFIALIALFDPIRKTVKYSLDTARKLGLQVKIITGDDSAIAGNIALQIDLIRNIQDIVTGEEFAIMSDKEKERIAQVVSVFARFLPEQKYEIITS